MNLLSDALYVAAGSAALVDASRRREWVFAAVSAIFGGFLVIDLVTHPDTTVVHLGLAELLLAIVTVALVADAIGLPEPLGRRLHIGLHSREWEFDRALYANIRKLDRLIDEYPRPPTMDAYKAWQSVVATSGPRLVARMRHLNPPDESWRLVANGYADLYEGIIDRIVSGRPADDELVKLVGDELLARRENLRRRYRDDARSGTASRTDKA